MPLQGLPFVLENTLENLLMQNALSSWIMKGGNKFTQVCLRFKSENMATSASNAEVQYRRTAPSRLARDRLRASERQQVHLDNNNQHEQRYTETSIIDSEDKLPHCQPQTREHHVNTRSSVPLPPAPSPGIPALNFLDQPSVNDCEMVPDHASSGTGSNIGAVANTSTDLIAPCKHTLDELDTFSLPDNSIVECFDDSPDDKADSDSMCNADAVVTAEGIVLSKQAWDKLDIFSNKLDKLVENVEKSNNDQSVKETSHQAETDSCGDQDGTITCDGCGGMIPDHAGSFWYRCSECDDIDLCCICMAKDIHKHHNKHLCKFTCPMDWNQAYCDSCGLVFTKDNELYQCNKCEDYCLCVDCCLKKMMHIRHMKYLKYITAKDYIDHIT